MGFLDLFRPRWKHSDPAIRIEAVKSLTPEDLVELGHVVKRDKDARVRRLALKKISEPALLEEVAEHDPDESLRRDAADKRSELLLASALSDEDESESLDAVSHLSPPRVQATSVEPTFRIASTRTFAGCAAVGAQDTPSSVEPYTPAAVPAKNVVSRSVSDVTQVEPVGMVTPAQWSPASVERKMPAPYVPIRQVPPRDATQERKALPGCVAAAIHVRPRSVER